ncbi:MAG: hypothetical protein AB7O26_11665 [Planctomycetaceae bacterium]
MFRNALAAGLAASSLILCPGCAHFVEKNAIARFTKAFEGENLEALKVATSETFEQKALRRDEAVDDLKILKLYPPQDAKNKLETEILKVEDVSDDEKLVTATVSVGEAKSRKLQYRLTRDGKKGKWVVDDVLVKQNRKDLSAAKSVTEQMDLLHSVREFLNAWEKGDREAILAVCSPGTSKLLAELTPEQLIVLSKQIVGDKPSKLKSRPEAQLDGDDAIVRLNRSEGEIVLTYRLYQGDWKVVDAALDSKDEKTRVASFVKTAAVVRAVDKFLAAYRAEDKPALEKSTTGQLFNQSLKFADTKTLPLPNLKIGVEKNQVFMTEKGADLVTGSDGEVMRITLNRLDPDADGETPARFLVHEVTVYDNAHEKRLSAVFTSKEVMELFSRSFAERKLDVLKKVSTADFNKRVWDQLDTHRFELVKVDEIEPVTPKVLSTEFHGEVIEITVQQGSRVLSYILRDWSGRVCVDDVLMPVMDRPNSLKTTLEITIPIHNFAIGLKAADPSLLSHAPQIEFLQMHSSSDMNRVVWKQTEQVPPAGRAALPFLEYPLTAIKYSDTQALVSLGDDRRGARILLNKENMRFVVDQVALISGPEQSQRQELKLLMRTELANRGLKGPAEVPALDYASAPQQPAADPMSSQPVSIDPETEVPPEIAIPKVRTRRFIEASGTRSVGKPAANAE